MDPNEGDSEKQTKLYSSLIAFEFGNTLILELETTK